MSVTPFDVPIPPPAERTVTALIAAQAERRGDAPLLRIDERDLTCGELRDAIAARAGTLASLGVGPGDRVALIAGNRAETIELIFATMWLGAVAVPLNVAARGMQLGHMLENSGARLLLIEDRHAEALETIDRPLPELTQVRTFDGTADGRRGAFELVRLPAPAAPAPAHPAGPGDTAAILYTSGTTGPSKGVLCPHAHLWLFARETCGLLELRRGDVLHTTLPLFHVNALTTVLQALLIEGRAVVAPRFSASRFWTRLIESEATITYLLGSMVQMLVNQEPAPTDRAHRVRTILAPGTPPALHPLVRERFGVQLVEGYASTETNIVLGAPLAAQRPGVMGPVRPGFEAKAVDEHDVEVPDGVAGELVVRHSEPFAFATGYHRMPEQTVAARRNLWFHTGDRVVRDADGCFRFVDRLKDAIRRRGENISSWEVEQALVAHPAVAQAAVFPVPSELGEDEVMAALVPADGATIDPVELVRHCEPRLASFAIPRFVEVVDALPLTENGKVRKVVLRERGVTDATWDRERDPATATRPVARAR